MPYVETRLVPTDNVHKAMSMEQCGGPIKVGIGHMRRLESHTCRLNRIERVACEHIVVVPLGVYQKQGYDLIGMSGGPSMFELRGREISPVCFSSAPLPLHSAQIHIRRTPQARLPGQLRQPGAHSLPEQHPHSQDGRPDLPQCHGQERCPAGLPSFPDTLRGLR